MNNFLINFLHINHLVFSHCVTINVVGARKLTCSDCCRALDTCWLIETEDEDFFVRIDVLESSLEYANPCSLADYVQIRDGWFFFHFSALGCVAIKKLVNFFENLIVELRN